MAIKTRRGDHPLPVIEMGAGSNTLDLDAIMYPPAAPGGRDAPQKVCERAIVCVGK